MNKFDLFTRVGPGNSIKKVIAVFTATDIYAVKYHVATKIDQYKDKFSQSGYEVQPHPEEIVTDLGTLTVRPIPYCGRCKKEVKQNGLICPDCGRRVEEALSKLRD